MPRFRDLPLRRKLVLAVGLTSGAVLTVACAALFLFQAYSLRQSITREASAIARIVAAQTSAALAFEDRQAAAQALAALEATPHVVRALLVTRDGRTLAQYRAGYRGLGGRDGSARKQALLFGRLTHSEAVIVDGKAIGTLLLTVDFERPWRDLIASYVKAMGLMVAIALLLIFVLSRFFQRVVSEPTLRAEEALQRAHDGLEALVRARTQELAEANERLQGLDRLKSMFIASMSHELRTPLNAILGFVGIVLQGLSGELNAKQEDHLGRAYGAAKHLLDLINDAIDMSKIEAGYVDVHIEDFSLRGLLEEAQTGLGRQGREKGLALEILPFEDLALRTDRKRVLQCILNLLSNAVKYTERGTVGVEVQRKGLEVEIEVRDTGVGIAPDAMVRLFQPFERIDSPLRIRNPGTGLGLYLTRKIATELLQGTVTAQSVPGQGSTFRLRLPRVLAPD